MKLHSLTVIGLVLQMLAVSAAAQPLYLDLNALFDADTILEPNGTALSPPLQDGRNMVMMLGPTKNAGVKPHAEDEDTQRNEEAVQGDGDGQGPEVRVARGSRRHHEAIADPASFGIAALSRLCKTVCRGEPMPTNLAIDGRTEGHPRDARTIEGQFLGIRYPAPGA